MKQSIFFNDNYGFLLMQNDPTWGRDTFGNVPRLMPERTYIMFEQLKVLKGDPENGIQPGWKTLPEFKEYRTALKGVPLKSKSCADKEKFFNDLPDKFIKEFERGLEEHVLRRWRSTPLSHYTLGSSVPLLAKTYAQLLCDVKENDGVNEDGELVTARKAFPTDEVTLGDHHTMSRKTPLKIKINDCMHYLTDDVELSEVVKDKFVEDHREWIVKLACSETEVDLFDIDEKGECFISLFLSICCY